MWARIYGTGKKAKLKNQTKSELYRNEDNSTVIEIDKAQKKTKNEARRRVIQGQYLKRVYVQCVTEIKGGALK